jgi:hypothetical protein
VSPTRWAGIACVAALVGVAACDDDASVTAPPTATAPVTEGAPATTTSSSTGGADADYQRAIVRSLSAGEKGEIAVTPAQADCVAPKWLATIGVERLEGANITPAKIGDGVDGDGSALADLELSDAEAGELYDAFAACEVDVHASFVDSIRATSGLDTEAVTCLGDAIDDDLLRRVMVVSIAQGPVSIAGDPAVASDWTAALASCEAPTTSGG